MQIQKIDSFESFCSALHEAGFSIGGSNDEGVFSLCSYFSENIAAHTGDIETDPWEWRIRGITECSDLSYGKVFFNKGGWITREWYPCFLAARRGHKTFDEMYEDGMISNLAKRVYELIRTTPHLALHEIKIMLESGKELNSKIESALTMLQMKMLITISGQKFKLSREGHAYGWPVTTFCTVEDFFGAESFDLSCEISHQEAVDRITARILEFNPNANPKAIVKFIAG
jgi:hypothetical protein